MECRQTCLFISHVNPSTASSYHLRRPIQTWPGRLAHNVRCGGSMNLANSFFGNRFSLFFAIVLASVTLAGAQQQQTDTTPPTTPTNLTATAVSSSQINLSWTSSTDPTVKNQASGVKGYNVYRGGSLLTFVTTTSFSDSGLSASTSYSYQVNAADNANNVSSLSTSDTVATPAVPAAAAAAASNVRLTLSGTTAGLQWSGTPGVLYQAQCATDLLGPWVPVDAPTTTFAVRSLAFQPSAIYRVALFTNTTAYLANAPINLKDINAPSAPSGVSAAAPTCSQVNLSWAGSTDLGTIVSGTTYTSGLAGYLIYRDNVFLKQVAAQTTSTSDASVGESAAYSYTVAALDNAGNLSAASAPAGVTTPSCTQTPPSCAYSLSSSSASYDSASSPGSVNVSAGTGCAWTASTADNWLHPAGNGNGNGTLNYSVDANGSTSSRSGTITVADQTLTVNQTGAICAYSLSSSSVSYDSAGGPASVTVSAGTGCGWTASTADSWIHTTGGGNGSAALNYSVDANGNTSARSGAITVSGQTLTIAQSGNQPPVANAGPDLALTVGSNATFTASGSSDPDGAISSYQWTFGDGSTASGLSVSHTYAAAGAYTVTLTVTDNLGATAVDTALATVAAFADTTAPSVSLTSPASGSTVSNTVTLSASASDNVGGSGVGHKCALHFSLQHHRDGQRQPQFLCQGLRRGRQRC